MISPYELFLSPLNFYSQLGAAPYSPVPDLRSSQHPADHQYASQSSPHSEYYSGGIAAPANQTESLTYSPEGSWTQPYTVNGQQYEQSPMHYPSPHQDWSQRSLPHHQDNNNWSPQHHHHPHLLMQQQHYAPAAVPGGYHSQHFPPNIMYPGYSPSVYGHGSVGGNRHNTNYVSQLSNGDDSIGSGIYHGIVRQHSSSNNNNNHRRRSSTKKRIEKEKIITILGCNINPDSGSLISIKGHVVKIAKEQEGSRFIQQRLVVSTSDEVQIVFDEVMPVIDELWNDVYGNFIVQKLLEFGTPDMKGALANRLLSETITLSTKVYGCRVIQKALDELNRADVAKLISTFKDNVLLCLNDHNGNHVIQKAITIMFTLANDAREAGNEDLCYLYLDSINPIIDDIILLIEVLGQHTYGCRAVQRMVEYCIEPQKSKILDSITVCHETLLCHAYGNYVIQKVLEHGRPIDRDAVFHLITKSVNLYSKQKQASNVVEALLRYGNAQHRHEIVKEMLHVSLYMYML